MSLNVERVEGSRGISEFVEVAWRIPEARRHPAWVPPLRMMVRDALDTKRNPFYRQADRALFVARRGRELVGRIAAIENRAHNMFHGERIGFFGFFESVTDSDVARALVDEAAAWLRMRGLTAMRGPMNPSTNHECGLLVDGFDEHPMFLTPWNPPSYRQLLEGAGCAPVRDLLGYWLPYGEPGYKVDPRIATLAERAAARANITFRDLEPSRYWAEVQLVWDIYNSAWEKNWGFVPMSRAEFMHMARSLKPLLVPQFAFLAEVGGEPAGFMLCVPDFNLVAKRIPNGRLFPFGALKILRARSRLRTGRIIALGIKEKFRTGSVLPLFMHEATRRALAYGSPGAEASWVLEDNTAMRQPIESFGGRIYRRWRIFERSLGIS